MTTLIINGKETHDIVTHDGQSILDVLLAAQEKYWGSEASICGITIDGESQDPIDETSLRETPAQGRRIEIELNVPQQRNMSETLDEAVEYLSRLESGLEELSSKIRLEGDAGAYAMLRDGLDGLSQIVELVANLVQEESGEAFKNFVTTLSEKCEEMTDAQESQDPTLIADILEYEILESVQELGGYLEKVRSTTT